MKLGNIYINFKRKELITMGNFLLGADEKLQISALVNTKNIYSFTIKEYAASDDGCDRYDCFFRSVQCPCEGICDGKA